MQYIGIDTSGYLLAEWRRGGQVVDVIYLFYYLIMLFTVEQLSSDYSYSLFTDDVHHQSSKGVTMSEYQIKWIDILLIKKSK